VPDSPAPGHDHSHAPNHHRHGLSAGADRRLLAWVLGLIGAFMVAEVVVAVASGSLALLADAGHMLTDAGAIAGSLWALRLAQRPHTNTWSYGLKRAEILAAAANGVTLVVIGALILNEAVQRLIHPSAVAGPALVIVAVAGIAVNLAAAWLLGRANRTSLNIEGAYQHILTDLYGFVGTAAAGIVVITTGWRRADSIASLLVVVLVLRAAWGLLRASGHVLLEGTPEGVDLDEIRTRPPRLDPHVGAPRSHRACGGHRFLPVRRQRRHAPRPAPTLHGQPLRRRALHLPARSRDPRRPRARQLLTP
jgi:cobalt-zinc-cadmium efflux system protein